MWQVLIHITLILPAIGIAYVDKLSDCGMRKLGASQLGWAEIVYHSLSRLSAAWLGHTES